MKHIRDKGLRWPDIQRALDAGRLSQSSREGMGGVAGDARNHRGGEVAITASFATNQYYYQSDRGNSGIHERWGQRGTQV